MIDIEQFRPSRLWKQMSQERKLQAAEAFWRDDHSVEQHPEAVLAIAQHLKFRPKTVAVLPIAKRTRYLAGLPAVSDILAGRLLVAYHLSAQRPMMGEFLDSLGIAHEDGLITEEDVKPPAAEIIQDAARSMTAKYPREDVALYFATLISQDPDTWGGLQDVLSASAS